MGALTLAAAVPAAWPIYLGLGLFAIGLYGVTCRRNILLMLLSVEIMLNAANVVFVGFSRIHHDLSGQVFVFFAMTVAAAEVAVGLAIVIAVYRLRRSTNIDDAQDLRDVDQGPIPPLKLEGEPAHHDDEHDHHEGDHEREEASAPVADTSKAIADADAEAHGHA